jgi:hypothetical protein
MLLSLWIEELSSSAMNTEEAKTTASTVTDSRASSLTRQDRTLLRRIKADLLVQSLQSVFKGRANESRGRDTAIERCDVTLQDQPDQTECRLMVKMLCKYGES